MKQIRRSVFETNSSSMHSLVIISEDTADEVFEDVTILVSKEDILDEIEDLISGKTLAARKYENWYFGRAPFKILSSFYEKFKYAYSNLIPYSNNAAFWEKQLLNVFKMLDININKIKAPEEVGVDEARLESWLNKYNITIADFLLNRRYVVVCDGDEYCVFHDMIESGIINIGCIENVKDVLINNDIEVERFG